MKKYLPEYVHLQQDLKVILDMSGVFPLFRTELRYAREDFA